MASRENAVFPTYLPTFFSSTLRNRSRLNYYVHKFYKSLDGFFRDGDVREYVTKVQRREFIGELTLERNRLRHALGSVDTRYWDWGWKHVMVLDAEDELSLERITRWLGSVARINYATIESSHGRYWIVTDYTGRWRDVSRLTRIIPGVSPTWQERCHKFRRIHVRAMPTIRGLMPDFRKALPNRRLANPASVEWLEALHLHYTAIDVVQMGTDWGRKPVPSLVEEG